MEQKKVSTKDYVIAVYDIENFLKISKSLNPTEVFTLMNKVQICIDTEIAVLNPELVKNIGDSSLMIFNNQNIDNKVLTIYQLQKKLQTLLKAEGFPTKVSFSLHYGELALGSFGLPENSRTEAFGEALNIVFALNGKPYRGRFTITPQLFRKLQPSTRKSFHKFTPQIMYTAE